MAMRHVRLELARTPDHPDGSIHCGYELNLPLTQEGGFDMSAWPERQNECTVRRFWEGEDDENGQLIQVENGWALSYDPNTDEDDEPLFKLENHAFKQGEYISITEHDGVMRTFRVIYVR